MEVISLDSIYTVRCGRGVLHMVPETVRFSTHCAELDGRCCRWPPVETCIESFVSLISPPRSGVRNLDCAIVSIP